MPVSRDKFSLIAVLIDMCVMLFWAVLAEVTTTLLLVWVVAKALLRTLDDSESLSWVVIPPM